MSAAAKPPSGPPDPDHIMPTSFWQQPELLIKNDAVKVLYAEVAAQLRDAVEKRGGDILDFLLAERTAALYGYIRERETGAGFANDRNRKETIQLWVQLATTLKKTWVGEDSDKGAERVANAVTKAMAKALEDVPLEYAKDVQASLQSALAEAGL